ncbi:group II intron reverse transcriptase domain-containing protein [Candidatus Nomurabacteria bacterium]|nr:group II intron reverse transcriptase domain-containing protein [Candidatus Kaiserbacteria bacterium]MCB9815501.1 group II intron reverse transcriptase domain-containing protein [Candidatus Nomurabacteria bacterium]
MHRKNDKKLYDGDYERIISFQNLLLAWRSFKCGKQKKIDVQVFERDLLNNIMKLHAELRAQTYQHGSYKAFKINDPKPRDIHKATVRDRVVHHALYRDLAAFYFPLFIADSYSCQNGKGTHKALDRFTYFARKVSQNHTKTCWVLKCDVVKFFASIDQGILLEILDKRVIDNSVLGLIRVIVESFSSGTCGKGLPLGNLTSQLLVNVYMNEFDQFVKHTLKAEYYIRYADDFVILSCDRAWLTKTFHSVERFLQAELALELHPRKVSIETISSGVDFLGWVHFPCHRSLRTTTRRRVQKGAAGKSVDSPTIQSYLGLLSHGDTKKLERHIRTNLCD